MAIAPAAKKSNKKKRDASTLAGLPAVETQPTDPELELGLDPSSPAPPAASQEKDDKTEFQRLLEEVESGFDAILLDEAAPATGGTATSDFDSTEVGTLFEQIAVAHARPVRDFMVEIKLGEPPTSWVAFCLPAVKALERSARGMELLALAEELTAFAEALASTATGSGAIIRDPARQAIIDAYGALVARMPDAFGLETESNRREAVIVHALLAQVPGLHQVGVDHLFDAGLTSLILYWVAKPVDLVEAAHLEIPVAERVIERFARYREETAELVPDDGRALELGRVESLCETLERTAASYDEAAASWSAGSGARRKELRRARADTLAQLRLMLGRLGELALIERIDALPAAAKVTALRAFVAEARRSWKAPPDGGRNPVC